jgi:hypothetical protein
MRGGGPSLESPLTQFLGLLPQRNTCALPDIDFGSLRIVKTSIKVQNRARDPQRYPKACRFQWDEGERPVA